MSIFKKRYSLGKLTNLIIDNCYRTANLRGDLKSLKKKADTEAVIFLNQQIQNSVMEDPYGITLEDEMYADWFNKEANHAINEDHYRVILISTISSAFVKLGIDKLPEELNNMSSQKMIYVAYMSVVNALGQKPYFEADNTGTQNEQ